MTLVRLATGEVLLHSPLALTEELREAVEREGELCNVSRN
jgi:hypothetical protein